MAKSLSAATKLKIARSLKGNKNAFKGGSKARLSTRQKIANINASTKAKKANLSSDQIARRQSVAKRLRAQARREEALGGGNPAEMKTNVDAMKEALAKSDRLAAGSIETQRTAKNADDLRKALAQVKEARATLKEGMPRSARKESAAKTQPRAKQDLNAPQKPAEQRTAALSPAQRRRQQRSKFEADQSKARLTPEQNRERAARVAENRLTDQIIARQRQNEDREIAKFKANRQAVNDAGKRQARSKEPLQTDARGNIVQRASGSSHDVLKAYAAKRERDKPQPPQSDTGSDRSGTFTKKVPVKGEKSTRSNGRKAIETEEDLQDFIAEKTPDIIRKLAKGIPQNDLRDLKAMIGKEMGAEGLNALNDILKG